jgi:hypothetical protein
MYKRPGAEEEPSLEKLKYHVVISGVSTSFGRASCLSGPCESGSWCVQGASFTEHACLQPTSSDCSFEEDLCGFNGLYATITSKNSQSAIIENMPYHDHTFGNCAGNKSYRRVHIVVYFTFWAQFHVRIIDGCFGVQRGTHPPPKTIILHPPPRNLNAHWIK